jgi:hypothetical protein
MRAVDCAARSRRAVGQESPDSFAARAAGQWERVQRSKRALPYLLYVRTVSAEPRQEHLAWSGTILPVDHPFWKTHFPPNGWGCKCAVRAVTAREAEGLARREGYSTEAPPTPTEPFVNRRTGELANVPAGIDPGWQTNPGLARARTLTRALQDKMEEAGPKRARAAIQRMWSAKDDMRLLMRLPERLSMPAGISEAAQAALQAKSPVVAVYSDGLNKKTAPPDNRDPARFALVQRIMDEGEMIDEGRAGARTYFATIDGQPWELVVSISKGGYLWVRTLHQAKLRDIQAARRRAETGK